MSPRFPPTPAMSGGFIIKDQPDGSDAFALPPAALSPANVDLASRRSSGSDPSYVPASPTSPDLATRRSAPSSRLGTGTKRSLEEFDLPPPPTRTRKIIQMKPKSPAVSKSSARSQESGKASSQTSPENASASTTKKKPSATSAAGRKTARKTAHSLIERRRRSKMNEEFGTLKDMIPACQGQDMHKLAILQASIDYVDYLKQCIHDLKMAGTTNRAAPPSPTSPEFVAETAMDSVQQPHRRPPSSAYSYSESGSASPKYMPPSTQMSDVSPSFSPRTRDPSAPTLPDAPYVLPSPAFGPLYPSMDKVPELQGMDHEASAALLMLTQDRRGTADSITEHLPGSTKLMNSSGESRSGSDGHRRKGMSVRDLLIS